MATIDLTPDIVQTIRNHPQISTLVGDRVGSPRVDLIDGQEAPNPKLSIRQMGGTYEYHRYLFSVEADDLSTARSIAIQIRDLFEDNAIDFTAGALLFASCDGGLTDGYDEGSNSAKCIFYIKFETPYN